MPFQKESARLGHRGIHRQSPCAQKRDFTEMNHWDLDADGIRLLKDFLIKHLG
jgi:hypothetical protein